MDQPVHRSNQIYLTDFIEFCFSVKHIDFKKVRHFYLEERHSAVQIARRFGVSKTSIVGIINRLGIGSKTGRMTHPNNYRHHNPPYGFRVIKGRLTPDKVELRFCRMIVELIGRQGFSGRATARDLERRGVMNRRGKVKWSHLVILEIYRRWRDKF